MTEFISINYKMNMWLPIEDDYEIHKVLGEGSFG